MHDHQSEWSQCDINILLTVNDKFMLPAKLCILSLLKNHGLNAINRIVINDTGLSHENKEMLLALHHSIEFVSLARSSSSYVRRHTKEWLKAVRSKTEALKWCIEQDILPIVMLDSDQFVFEDFSELLQINASCIVCKRSTPVKRPDGRQLDYIGSFFVALNHNALEFVDRWSNRITELEQAQIVPPYETPALCEVIREFQPLGTLSKIEDEIVSSPNVFIEGKTRIFHYKSEVSGDVTGNVFLDRCDRFQERLPIHFQEFLEKNISIEELRSTATSSQHSERAEWSPPQFIVSKALSLDDLGIIFRSDKSSLKHSYTSTYAELLESLKDNQIKLLEIGVANGSSLKMWASYLPNAEVHGVDVDEKCKELCTDWDRIKIFIGDAKKLSLSQSYDVIIDDGSHVSKDMHDNFLNLWKHLKPGGYYFVEDTQCTFNINQAKYYTFRKTRDFRRYHFLNLVNLILWNLDQRNTRRAIDCMICKPGLMCIKKSKNEGALLNRKIDSQHGFQSLKWLLKQRVRKIFRRGS